MKQAKTYFDGETYEPELDQERLTSQLERVKTLMLDGHWRVLAEISTKCGGTEAAVSARLRDLRKERFGSFIVERRRSGNPSDGKFEYRVLPSIPQNQSGWLFA